MRFARCFRPRSGASPASTASRIEPVPVVLHADPDLGGIHVQADLGLRRLGMLTNVPQQALHRPEDQHLAVRVQSCVPTR